MEKIGYMGIAGSFSEIAAIDMAGQMDRKEVEYEPLVCAMNILKALEEGKISYGVLAVKNSTAGPVSEFVKAFEGVSYEVVKEYVLPIHHCLFKKSGEVRIEDLKIVASHPQALKQTEGNRKAFFSHMKEQAIEDTAIGAEWLAVGKLDEDTAVICSKKAGESWGLDLIRENIEDSADNKTTFWMLRLK